MTTTLGSLKLFFIVENIDYNKLINIIGLRTNFINTVRANVASKAGVSESMVSVELSPGSVQITSTIKLLANTRNSDEVMGQVQDGQANMTATILQTFETLTDFQTVKTGDVTVAQLSYLTNDITSTTTTTATTSTTTTTRTTSTTSTTTPANFTTTDPNLARQTTEPSSGFSILGVSQTATAAIGGAALVALILAVAFACVCGVRYCRRGSKDGKTNELVPEKKMEEEGNMNLAAVNSPSQDQPEPEGGLSPSSAQQQFQFPMQPHYSPQMQPPMQQPYYQQPVAQPRVLGEDRPGRYEIIVDSTAVGPSLALGDVISELELGALVEVLEVVHHYDDQRVRARIAYPPGWISLSSLAEGDDRRWARRLLDANMAAAATPASLRSISPQGMPMQQHQLRLPQQQYQYQQGMKPIQTGMGPGYGPGVMGGTPMSGMGMAPGGKGMQPIAPVGLGMGPPSVISLMNPQGGQMMPSTQASVQPASRTSSPTSVYITGMILPGDFVVGEQVMALVDFSGASGQVSVDEVGIVAGPCKGYNGAGAQARLNCKFPRHPNINLKVTQISRVNPRQVLHRGALPSAAAADVLPVDELALDTEFVGRASSLVAQSTELVS